MKEEVITTTRQDAQNMARELERFKERLNRNFAWTLTPQGHAYWDEVYEKLSSVALALREVSREYPVLR